MADYYSPPPVVAVLGLIDTYNRWKNANQPPRGHEHFHPSAFGKCLRKMQYDRYVERGYMEGSSEDFKSNVIRIFDNGHGMHRRWGSYFEDLGVLRGVWQCENPMCAAYSDEGATLGNEAEMLKTFQEDQHLFYKQRRFYGKEDPLGCFKPATCICGCTSFEYHEISVVSAELNFRGHCDGIIDFSRFDPAPFMSVQQSYAIDYLPKTPFVVDMKSCNTFDFQNVAEGNPHDYYVTQLTIYANLLDLEFGLLLYENKNDQKTMAFSVPRNADTTFALIKAQAQKMIEMTEVIDDDGVILHLLPPPRPLMKEDKECQWCPYKDNCHASSVWDRPDFREFRAEFYGKHKNEARTE